jgi:hypothetical protein
MSAKRVDNERKEARRNRASRSSPNQSDCVKNSGSLKPSFENWEQITAVDKDHWVLATLKLLFQRDFAEIAFFTAAAGLIVIATNLVQGNGQVAGWSLSVVLAIVLILAIIALIALVKGGRQHASSAEKRTDGASESSDRRDGSAAP